MNVTLLGQGCGHNGPKVLVTKMGRRYEHKKTLVVLLLTFEKVFGMVLNVFN